MQKRTRSLILGAGIVVVGAAAVTALQRRKATPSGEGDGQQRSSKVYEYTKVEGDFFESAPVGASLTKRMPVSAAMLFRVLEDAEAWPQWLDAIQEVTWTAPLGVGATREVKMGSMTLEEHFFEWEDGRLMGLRFERSPLPVIEAFAERWQIEPVSDTECELTWTYGLQARGPLKAAHGLIAKGFTGAGEKWLDQLAEYAKTHAADYQDSE